MSRWTLFLSCLAVLVIAVGISGCADSPAPVDQSQGTVGADDDHDHDVDADHDHAEIPKGFEDLSADDRAAALKQATCPVLGGKLGAMGTPYKINVQGRDVFLCCEGCKEELLKDPDKYLAKLEQ